MVDRRRGRVLVLAAVALLASSGAVRSQSAGAAAARDPVVVASKPFGESFLLAEMFAQLLEAGGIPVERRPGLGATEIAFGALRAGAIDVYPEYTGTGLVAILGEEAESDPGAVFNRVAAEFPRRFATRWLPPLGFQNTYAIAVRRETAERLGLATLSDLAASGENLRAGFSPDFIGRPDGLPALNAHYDLSFAEERPLLQAVKYQALGAGEVDLIDGYSTDGFIARYDLIVLRDDRGAFPAYEAAALVSDALSRRPEAIAALVALSGRLDEGRMRMLNQRIEADGEEITVVATDALGELDLIDAPDREVSAAREGAGNGFLEYLWSRRVDLIGDLRRHLVLVGASLLLAIAAAVTAGLALERSGAIAEPAIRLIGAVQTIPGIALIAFMIPLLGIGVVPALFALFLYSLYPILRNTYTGVRHADVHAVDSAKAMGMTPTQVLRYVRLPLAAPTIMAGIRTAAVINVGTATLAAFIGAGGLGDPIVTGLALSDTRMILSGAIPAALLALTVDALLGAVEIRLRPGGRGRKAAASRR